ncbi:MAG: DUF4331 family protein [Kofleriaceae bacterium]
MKKLAYLGGVAGAGIVAALVATQTGYAADHLDSSTLATNPLADLNDVYTWMNGDASKVNLAMTISPADTGRAFGPDVQYVFHVTSKSGLGVLVPDGKETRVICTFASSTSAECWIADDSGTKDYVTGDPSNTAGITSTSGKVRLFAGRRSDPFFFNLQGFRDAVGAVRALPAATTFDAAGCPTKCGAADATQCGTAAGAIRGLLSGQRPVPPTPPVPACPINNKDCFINLNVLAIVIQVDKTLFNTGSNTSLAVWGSTHATP